jgi:ornithine decarboxylase
MFTATRTGRTSGVVPDAPPVLEVDMDRLVERHGLPLVVLDIGRAARQYRAVRSAFPTVDVHYDVSALSHPALITAIAADGGSFAISHDGALEALTNSVDLSRVLHATPVVHPHEVLAAYNAGVRRFIVDGPADVEKFVGYPADLCLLVRLRPDNPVRAHAMPRGIRSTDAVRVVRFASSLGIRIAGFSLSLPRDASPQCYVSHLASVAGLMADVEAATGLRFDTIDLGDTFPGTAAVQTDERAELHRAIQAILAPTTSRMSVTASASRAVTAGCITVVAGTIERDVDPLVASDCIDDGAGVAVIGTQTWSSAG